MLRRFWLLSLIAAIWAAGPAFAQKPKEDVPASDAEVLVRSVFHQKAEVRDAALRRIELRGKTDVVAGLIRFLRYSYETKAVVKTLERITGAKPGPEWSDWMLWQETNPDIPVFEGHDGFLADRMARIDDKFRLFLQRGVKHEIRLEEITWGGVVKDGIPALTNPDLVSPDDELAAYLKPDELVFGVSINGDTRAYPLRFLDWHEMFNDVIGGKPVSLAYCTLCGSGILFETTVKGREKPFVFGSSGFLYRSNKLMYDKETNSLWNQFTGRPVVGPLTGSGIELKILPVVITSWEKWYKKNPDSKVLSEHTGYYRDYRPGRPYSEYFNSPELMFPALVRDKRLAPKDYVFAVRALGPDGKWAEKAWPVTDFNGFTVINDTVGKTPVVLIGDAGSRTVRAFESGDKTFKAVGADGVLGPGGTWQVTDTALTGPDGQSLKRLPGHIAYWFAWQGYKPKAPYGVAKK